MTSSMNEEGDAREALLRADISILLMLVENPKLST
jgi:hypothetical protein